LGLCAAAGPLQALPVGHEGEPRCLNQRRALALCVESSLLVVPAFVPSSSMNGWPLLVPSMKDGSR